MRARVRRPEGVRGLGSSDVGTSLLPNPLTHSGRLTLALIYHSSILLKDYYTIKGGIPLNAIMGVILLTIQSASSLCLRPSWYHGYYKRPRTCGVCSEQ